MTQSAQVYRITGPATDGELKTEKMSSYYKSGSISVVFKDSAGNVVTPGAGTITFSGSETDEQYGEIGQIDATTAGEPSTYTRITFGGLVRYVKATLSGVTGADSVEVRVARYIS